MSELSTIFPLPLFFLETSKRRSREEEKGRKEMMNGKRGFFWDGRGDDMTDYQPFSVLKMENSRSFQERDKMCGCWTLNGVMGPGEEREWRDVMALE